MIVFRCLLVLKIGMIVVKLNGYFFFDFIGNVVILFVIGILVLVFINCVIVLV